MYAHADSAAATVSESAAPGASGLDTPSEWGKVIREDAQGRPSVYERDLGHGKKVLTHVFWAE